MSIHDHVARQARPQSNPQPPASQPQPPPPPLYPVASTSHGDVMTLAPQVSVLMQMQPSGPPMKFEEYLNRPNQRLPGGDHPPQGAPRHENRISTPHLPVDVAPPDHETAIPLSHDDSSSRPRSTLDQPVNNPNAVLLPVPAMPRAFHVTLHPPMDHLSFLGSTSSTKTASSESLDYNKPSTAGTRQSSTNSVANTVNAEDHSTNPNCRWLPRCQGSDKRRFCATCKMEGYHADLARIEAAYSGIIEELDKTVSDCKDRSARDKFEAMTRYAKAQREAAKAKWYQ